LAYLTPSRHRASLPWAAILLAAVLIQFAVPVWSTPETGVSAFPAPVGAAFRDRDWAPEMVVVPTGRFMMGSTEAETTREGRASEFAAWERPRHAVDVSKPLAIGRYPVTLAEFARFVEATGRVLPGGCNVMEHGKWGLNPDKLFKDPAFPQTDRNPVLCVTWQDANAYAAWLSTETGHRYRLLREAEFEYAVRGGTTTVRWWGDDPGDQCKHANGADISFDKAAPGDPKVDMNCDDGFAYANPVGAFPPNPYGLYDMLGNVWEWTADCFNDSYQDAPREASAPVIAGDCSHRVIRGGSWHNYPNVLRAANRFNLPVDMRSSSLGFRVARLPD
jgi:formylglycine-generating enzyme required for sulfatase activity